MYKRQARASALETLAGQEISANMLYERPVSYTHLELPAEWEGNLKLTDSEEYDGAVELRTVDEDQLVLTVQMCIRDRYSK